jgi:hypothetical protein
MEGWCRLGWATVLQGEARQSTSCERRVTRLGGTPRADAARGFPTELGAEDYQDQVGGARYSSPARGMRKDIRLVGEKPLHEFVYARSPGYILRRSCRQQQKESFQVARSIPKHAVSDNTGCVHVSICCTMQSEQVLARLPDTGIYVILQKFM